MTATNHKQTLRREMLTHRRSLSTEWIQANSAVITRSIADWTPFAQAKTVMMYLAMPDEPQVDQLITLAIAAGKTVCVPALGERPGHMEAVEITDINNVVFGTLGLRMPIKSASVIHPDDIDLILVPGVAFDISGNRIGMGAGYYDRFLCRAHRAVPAGVVWDFQIVPALLAEQHDVAVQYLFSEQQIILCHRGKV